MAFDQQYLDDIAAYRKMLDSESDDAKERGFETFIKLHLSQLESIGLPSCKWKTLYYKLSRLVFDAGDYFSFGIEEYEHEDIRNFENDDFDKLITNLTVQTADINIKRNKTNVTCKWKVYTNCPMDPDDNNLVFLIDHTWTYTLKNAQKSLEENHDLVERMSLVMDIPFTNRPIKYVIDDILVKMWKYNNSYYLCSSDKDVPSLRCWFVMDEFGIRINHSDDPSFKVVTFNALPSNVMFSLLFPLKKAAAGDEVTRNFLGFEDAILPQMLKALKYPWESCDMSYVNFNLCEPDVQYFRSGRCEEYVPDKKDFDGKHLSLPNDRKIKVYAEYEEVENYLKHPRFEITDNSTEADIHWLCGRFTTYNLIADGVLEIFVNQFPSEHVLISKDLLAVMCRRHAEKQTVDPHTLKANPHWLPATYNLMTELPQLVSYFEEREKRGLDNIWICKPFNLARGLDITITDNLNCLIRLAQTGPKVACKYITDPVLFPVEEIGLVKMDIRYIVLLKSIQPLEVYAYDRFWLRFANKPFSLDDFQDYEKHFTVMNYVDSPLRQMYCHEFITTFEKHYTLHKWSEIEQNIYKMIKNIFVGATMKDVPEGIGAFPASRAVYGLDIMLEWDRRDKYPLIKPVLLEVNWMPDCKRACQYYNDFYDDVFSVLFLEEFEGKHVVKL